MGTWDVDCGSDEWLEKDKELIQGDSWTIRCLMSDYYVDLIVKGAVRTAYQPDGVDVFDFEATASEDNLEWVLTATPALTATLDLDTTYFYDVQFEIPSLNIKKTFVRGKINILGQVTP